MDRTEAMEKAAQAWCRSETSHIEMDVVLACSFATTLQEETESLRAQVAELEDASGMTHAWRNAVERAKAAEAQVERLTTEHEDSIAEVMLKVALLEGRIERAVALAKDASITQHGRLVRIVFTLEEKTSPLRGEAE